MVSKFSLWYVFSLGLAWLGLSFAKIKGESVIEKISKYTSQCVIRGILSALGISLALTGFEMLLSGLLFGIIAIILIVFLRNNKKALLVSFQLVSFIKEIKNDLRGIGILLVTAILSILTNMAVRFAVGVIVFYILKKINPMNDLET